MTTPDVLFIVAGAVLGVGIVTAITLTRRNHRPCEAQWVVDGVDTACGQPATQIIMFEGDVLRVCQQRGIDLSEFEQYRTERAVMA